MNELSTATTATIRDGQVVAWFETVGPERAKELLNTYNVDYRKFRPTYAEGLARDMESGNWNFDGSPIRISEGNSIRISEGSLFDGQHRLHAVIMSGTPQRFLFVSGLPKKAYNTTDTGLPRNYGDALRMRGFTNVSLRSALIKLISRWERGVSLDDSTRLTNSELDEIQDKYVDSINRAVQFAASLLRRSAMSGALLAFSFWILNRVDSEKVHTFLVPFVQGEHIGFGDPQYALRERLLAEAKAGRDLTRNEIMHLTFQAWNAMMDGKEITRLQLPKKTASRSNMVMPHGASVDS